MFTNAVYVKMLTNAKCVHMLTRGSQICSQVHKCKIVMFTNISHAKKMFTNEGLRTRVVRYKMKY